MAMNAIKDNVKINLIKIKYETSQCTQMIANLPQNENYNRLQNLSYVLLEGQH